MKNAADGGHVYEGRDCGTGELRRTATSVDLLWGPRSQLRALAKVYASDDARGKFVNDSTTAWTKVMVLDLRARRPPLSPHRARLLSRADSRAGRAPFAPGLLV